MMVPAAIRLGPKGPMCRLRQQGALPRLRCTQGTFYSARGADGGQ